MADDFYKRDIRAAISGMAILTLEERGAYNTILDYLYLYGCPIVDNERYLSGIMNCHVLKWRHIRNRLVTLGKLVVNPDGTLDNPRAVVERLERGASKDARRLAGSKGGVASGQSRKNKDLGEAHASTQTNQIREEKSRVEERGAASQLPADKYAFTGTYVRGISEKDLQGFMAQYGTTRERMLATLRRCDDWYIAHPDRQRKNWFFSIDGWLKNEDFSKKPADKALTFREREEKAQRDELDALRRIAI